MEDSRKGKRDGEKGKKVIIYNTKEGKKERGRKKKGTKKEREKEKEKKVKN